MDDAPFSALVADDDPRIARLVEEALKLEGCQVTLAYDGEEALRRTEELAFHVAVVDLEMPGANGQEVIRRLRELAHGRHTFVLVLTSHAELSDKIASFHAGADDFMAKPFELMELSLRLRAALRRVGRHRPPIRPIETGVFALEPATRRVRAPHGEWILTPMEFQLLAFLAEHAGQFYQSEELLQAIWNYPPKTGDPNLIRYHVRNLRKKIEPDPVQPRYLLRLANGGYGLSLAASKEHQH